MSTDAEAELLNPVPVRYAVLPMPVVDWTMVVKADSPTREATRGRLRELRKKHRVGDGVTVTRRGERGLEGRATYYSVLSALAARSRQEGHDEDAVGLEQSGSELEARFGERLRAFLGRHSLAQLPEAKFSAELTTATAERLAEWSRLPQVLLAAAVVVTMDGDLAHLDGSSPRGLPVVVDLPRVLLERQSLKPGDVVWVFSRVVGDAVLVELLPAVRVPLRDLPPDRLSAGLAGLVDISWTEERPAVGDDGLTDTERAESAQRYWAGVGANLTAEHVAELKADLAAGRVPRRRLRPAG